jgi:hypothetical protein
LQTHGVAGVGVFESCDRRVHAVLGMRNDRFMGTRRLAAVLVVAACAVGSARLWTDALTPAAVPFVEPFSTPGGSNAAPKIIVVTATEPRAGGRFPKVVRKTTASSARTSRIVIVKTPIPSVAPTQTPAEPRPQTPAKPVPIPRPPKAIPPVVTPAPPAPAPQPPAPQPPPVAAAPIVLVAAPVAAAPAAPGAPPPQSATGHGHGDKGHGDTGHGNGSSGHGDNGHGNGNSGHGDNGNGDKGNGDTVPTPATPLAPAAPPTVPAPCQQPPQSDSRPGHGNGDDNDSHTGPPGHQGK